MRAKRESGRSRNLSPCVFCGATNSSQQNLEMHISTHTKERPYDCPDCDANFTHASAKSKHRKSVHQPTRNLNKDNPTNAVRQSKKSVQMNHPNKFAGDGAAIPNTCIFCQKGSSLYRILECHMRTHTNERPFQCTYCDTNFCWKQSLVAHRNSIHLGKQFCCNMCQKMFHYHASLSTHKKTCGFVESRNVPNLNASERCPESSSSGDAEGFVKNNLDKQLPSQKSIVVSSIIAQAKLVKVKISLEKLKLEKVGGTMGTSYSKYKWGVFKSSGSPRESTGDEEDGSIEDITNHLMPDLSSSSVNRNQDEEPSDLLENASSVNNSESIAGNEEDQLLDLSFNPSRSDNEMTVTGMGQKIQEGESVDQNIWDNQQQISMEKEASEAVTVKDWHVGNSEQERSPEKHNQIQNSRDNPSAAVVEMAKMVIPRLKSDRKLYLCEFCQVCFSRKSFLKNHVRSNHRLRKNILLAKIRAFMETET